MSTEAQRRLDFPARTPDSSPVDCLGFTFDSDVARREYFLEQLRRKLEDPVFRDAPGFPSGTIHDILALSDPPYYTACPNPFIDEFVAKYGRRYDSDEPYSREPFSFDVREGKNNAVYGAHGYHTKVPHPAVMRYILHYTEPGDIVFDGFCGTGMVGVAAQLCSSRAEVRALGYDVHSDGTIVASDGARLSELGERRALLNDLSPAAAFIASRFNRGIDIDLSAPFMQTFIEALREIERQYWTIQPQSGHSTSLAYIVWSDIFYCNNCTGDIIFWDAAVDAESGKVAPEVRCPHCDARFRKRVLERPFVAAPAMGPGQVVEFPRLEPVLVGIAQSGGKRVSEQAVGALRDELLAKHAGHHELRGFPDFPLDVGWEMYRHGMGKHRVKTHRQLYIPSTAATLVDIHGAIMSISDADVRNSLLWVFTSIMFRCSKFNRRLPSGGGAPITGVLYIPSMIRQENPVRLFMRKLDDLAGKLLGVLPRSPSGLCLQTGDIGTCKIPPNSIDYAFVDPPFGSNIFYADMNFLWESWLRVFTDRKPEAIVSDRALSEKKSLNDYGQLMYRGFQRVFDGLKPGRWMTVEFHNSENSVWNMISESIQRAGFVIADVRTLDKKQKSFRQTTALGAVKQDLIISAYKPNGGLEDTFEREAGSEDGVWAFVRTHLRHIPVFVSVDGQCELITERQEYLLFDRMVAFHVQRNVTVPVSASEFYSGLTQRFSERDGMYFLSEQVAEYDKKRMTVREVLQLQLFVTDEASAIQWLKQQLTKKPQGAGDLKPRFMQEMAGWQKSEKLLELDELLEQNFLRWDGQGETPSQIHSYLSTNFKELRNKPKDDPGLCAKGKDRWYVPDPNRAGDLEKLRERALLREFWEYLPAGHKPAKPESQEGFIPGLEPKPTPIPKGEKMKVIRLEAVRAGFKQCWQDRDYRTIIAVAQRIAENVIQEDPKLLMWYDQALTRTGEDV